MSTRVISDIQKIDSPIADVYSFLSDFSKIGRLIETARQMGAGQQMSEISDKIENVVTTEDTCTFLVKGLGEMGVRIVEREEPKLIKLEGDGSVPFNFEVWIQLLDNGPYDTRLRITVEADLNMMMKMLLKGKLEKGINQLAEGLSKIPYGYMR
ncbi:MULTISPECIES: SRPBCC family protein [Odoribacteraceae]|uniref:SRPBCC family protein n=1 Tax=Odoribacteraceae TaxID=1853231 RepID=UPI000E480F8F|nr:MULTISPECIES: SRPBCC family protein [Odoribacteraceae]MCQ4873486.1 SRPBCC family protein [Butyricimonas paravirosa]RHR73194.1 SRPBCC family protein [Odoribacter sp. AF15-53]